MSKEKYVLFFIIAGALATTPFYLYFAQLQIDRSQDFSDVMATFGKLFIVAVLMERAVEVILSAIRSEKADEYDNRIREIEDEIALAEDVIRKCDAGTQEALTAQATLDRLKPTLTPLKQQRTVYRATSRIYALWIGLFIGLLVAAVGIRFLGTIVEIDPLKIGPESWQYALFVTVDIVLTGTLLAGGSDAFNKVTKAYGAFMDKIKESNRA